MAKRERAVSSRPRSRNQESLLIRSAESLGRVIGSLQRQLAVATKQLTATSAAARDEGELPRKVAKRAKAPSMTAAPAKRRNGGAKNGASRKRPAAKSKTARKAKTTRR